MDLTDCIDVVDFPEASGVAYRVMDVGASTERRSALAKRAAEIEIVPRTKSRRSELPTVPQMRRITESPGTQLAYRLPVVASPVWNLAGAAALALMWTGCAISLLGVSIVSFVEGQPRLFLTLTILPIGGGRVDLSPVRASTETQQRHWAERC
ncbi:MAG: hypothetical protein R3C05_15330 [Pirellulaceae bacterium]